MRSLGYSIAHKKLQVQCDCGVVFLHKLAEKIIKCPKCNTTAHKKWIFKQPTR